ncbi:hypothetical protein EDB80DRAFT_738509 [Ilyonectria destructans]|nr:hypothetical protein EDB80DRAFT_738509 [Ilyonectria destructans]
MSYHDTGSVMESNFIEPNALNPLAVPSSPGLWPFLRSEYYHQSSFGDPSTIDSTYQRQTIGPPACHLQYQALEEFQKDNRRNDGGDEVKMTSMECVFGSEKWPQAQTTLGHQWGSASNFNYHQDHIECMDQEMYGSM